MRNDKLSHIFVMDALVLILCDITYKQFNWNKLCGWWTQSESTLKCLHEVSKACCIILKRNQLFYQLGVGLPCQLKQYYGNFNYLKLMAL